MEVQTCFALQAPPVLHAISAVMIIFRTLPSASANVVLSYCVS